MGMEQAEGEVVGQGLDKDEFSSLRMQGGDVTRPIYRFVEQQQAEAHGISKSRSRSFAIERSPPTDETLNISSIKTPGGFRRDYIRRAAASPSPDRTMGESSFAGRSLRQPRQIFTTSFIEFLSLYGHFAGEEFDEVEEEESEEYFHAEEYFPPTEEGEEYGESSALLGTHGKRKRRRKEKVKHGGSPMGAAMLLLKSFVGTGVLFLPKAFLNGGMLFSCLVLLGIAFLSYYCFLLLCSTRLKVPVSFGGMGYQLYGKTMLVLINFSLVISQIGFSSAYIVFVSENLQAFIQAVSNCTKSIEVKYLILMQMIIFLPLSLYRNIQNIQKIAIIADLFILLGLLYLYYFDIYTLASQHGIADIVAFNRKDWTLFIGTAIFTFEGIGLIIPIQESMKEPNKFPVVLGAVMVIITVVFTSMGALSYAAYGSKTKTVVILNMPQDSKFVNSVQFIYSLAILLSTPLQFFPAIEITSLAIFSRTGKDNLVVKWKKNIFRFFMVVICALIAWIGADDLDKFVALVGSFACIPLVYIYPVSLPPDHPYPRFNADMTLFSRCYTTKPSRQNTGKNWQIL
jgi:proton-coupled amino acid transporter